MRALIVGGGIAGLSTALSLKAAGFDDVVVLESAPEVLPLGVGINLLPHAVRELTELGLADRLLASGLRTGALTYCNRYGQEIWSEPRGRAAGYAWPQVSVHRGHLQMLLLEAVRERLGADSVVTGARVTRFDDSGTDVRALGEDGQVLGSGALLIGADGIGSAVRRQLIPAEGEPSWGGAVLWRGTTWTQPYLDGRTMVMAGHADQKFVSYPLNEPDSDPRGSLLNWVAEIRVGGELSERASWNKEVAASVPLEHFGDWSFPWLDIPSIISAGEAVFEYPMVDREPLERWSFGRVTLVGDAAHAMYPIGSNGASQAILDARVLARELALAPVETALSRYESTRRPTTTALQRANRTQGPERVMTVVHDRAPHGFTSLSDVISAAELEETATAYKRLAGFDPAELTSRPSLGVPVPWVDEAAGSPWIRCRVEVGAAFERDGLQVVPILRGRVEGEIQGQVEGGEDVQTLRPDGVVDIDAQFRVRDAGDEVLTVRTTGSRAARSDAGAGFDLDVSVERRGAGGVPHDCGRGRARASKVGTVVGWTATRLP